MGFSGPFSGTKHQFMIFQQYRLAIPPNAEFSVPQLHMLLGEAEIITRQKITLEKWDNLI
ncbi:MAG: type II toxin-antitoxin system HicA family toxin [Dehalococcoidia bacterium]|nr:type II toxin-antitoxin system HicA family toxin [Dehalococcoidia bacterium]MDD5494647.1 type II toxin-antitoxin system HicA family toxin [Dehalococcoidia bacterium]